MIKRLLDGVMACPGEPCSAFQKIMASSRMPGDLLTVVFTRTVKP